MAIGSRKLTWSGSQNKNQKLNAIFVDREPVVLLRIMEIVLSENINF